MSIVGVGSCLGPEVLWAQHRMLEIGTCIGCYPPRALLAQWREQAQERLGQPGVCATVP